MADVTPKERTQAVEDFRRKMALERTFKKELKSLFSRMAISFKKSVTVTGHGPNDDKFLDEWKVLLRKHYERVQRSFAGDVQKFSGKSLNFSRKQEFTEEESEDMLILALLAWIDQNAPKEAALITSTNNKNMRDAMSQARQSLIDQGITDIDNRTLAAASVVILKRKFAGRVESIASFETQSAAESAKFIEAEVVAGVKPSVLGGRRFEKITSTKKWVTIGDNIVRVKPFNHREANGQIKKLNEYFEVSGELLRYPSDNSLGASAGNTIN